jgi:hypothetical protein
MKKMLQDICDGSKKLSVDGTLIQQEREKIQEGSFYSCPDRDGNINTGAPKVWQIKTPDTETRVHLIKFIFSCDGAGTLEFFRTAAITNDGTSLTIYNNDENSDNIATVLIYKDSIISGDPTDRLEVYSFGSVGGIVDSKHKWILKQGNSYILRFTANSDGIKASVNFKFYEV